MNPYDPKANYDAMALAYAEKNATSIWNAMYDRPNVINLIPKSNISHVVEVGCGSGILTEWLVNQNYHVTAFDISSKLVELTQTKIGSRANVFIGDASKPLDMIPTNSTDLIVSSLVFHYIENWKILFHELSRILKLEGILVFSTHHPHADWVWCGKDNYFQKELYEETWTIAEKPYLVQYYHRTLMEMFEVFKETGFYVDELKEPFPLPEVQQIDPKAYKKLTTKPNFLYFRLRKKNFE